MKVTEERRCCFCKHCIGLDWHGVKSICEIDSRDIYGYTGKDEHRLYAKDCERFEARETIWSNSEQKIVKSEDVIWI